VLCTQSPGLSASLEESGGLYALSKGTKGSHYVSLLTETQSSWWVPEYLIQSILLRLTGNSAD